ncbi:Zinc finger, RING/FYVE/PHD-type [Corchorus olitorius]|uniref:Zinc finger, RING/FYVE/PHD-type n=1 Tax=Corchorus olitorius TaxID=93759 RepID=A0A1R3J0E3_9ROSI|nr:Zinc finger, RING/FYVE/PHD-type [Corchorus olitorius]
MEDMDIDLVVDIPDTPDRLSSQRMNRGNRVEKESSSSVTGRFGGSSTAGEEYWGRLTGRGRLLGENGHNREHYPHARKPFDKADEIERQKNTIVLSSPENARGGASLFRKAAMERSRNSIREQCMDKGKALYRKLPSKSSRIQEDHAILDLTEQNVQKQMLEMAPPHDGLKNRLPEGRREGQVPRSGGSYLRNASKGLATPRDNCKGKEKIDDNGFTSVASDMVHGKGVGVSHDSSLRVEKPLPISHHSVVPPRATGQKRLVRNGCISPQNIAIRTKQLNEQSQNSSKTEQNFGIMVSKNPSMMDISEIVAEDNNYSKGKEVVHPHTSKEHDMNFVDLSNSPMNNNGKATGISHSSRDATVEEKGGWRSTHNLSKNVDYASAHHFSRFNDDVWREQKENRVMKRDKSSGQNNRVGRDWPENADLTETAPVIVPTINQISEPSPAINMLPKRQKKHVTFRNTGESSRIIPNDSDIMFLGSSREPSSSRSSSIHIGRHLDVLDLDGSSEMGGINANHVDRVDDEDSEARARQVEADEMLARELQEQLYHEVPIFGNGEIDENIAWALQQEEDPFNPTSIRLHHDPDNRGSTRHSRTQPLLRTSQNSSSRRGVQTRVPNSARMSRLRNRVLNQPRAAPSRTRNFRFPVGMDLETRMEILEAIETANDMGMASHIFQVQRDFNENDYEMLLALDENNHQHGGASTNLINSLPLSKVQTDNFEEACAICLETPTIGESIRHLPCLHKFHKDI